ncbi:MAG: two-component regulator propeller domain-containing protein [bacterium]
MATLLNFLWDADDFKSNGGCGVLPVTFVIGMLSFCCLQAAPLTIEEEYVVHRWGMEDGLPEGAITSVQQLSDGFLWLTTPRHVVRYDGMEFLSWQPGEESSCTLRRLRGLMQDKRGFLWLYGENGVMRREGSSWKSIELKREIILPSPGEGAADASDGGLQQKPQVEVFWVKQGPDGTIWAATNVGAFRFHAGVFTLVPPGRTASLTPFSSAIMDAQGAMVFAGQSGLFRFDGRSYQVSPFPTEGVKGKLFQVFRGLEGTLWGKRLDGKLFRRLNDTVEWVEFPPQGLRLATLLERRDELWLGASEGLCRCRQGVWHMLVLDTRSESVTDIRCLKETSDGSLWVGTGNGLLQLLPRRIRLHAPFPSEPRRQVTALLSKGEGRLLLGTSGRGVRSGSLQNNKPCFEDHPVLKTAEVSVLTDSGSGDLLVGTRGNHAWRVMTNGLIRQLCAEKSHLSREVSSLLGAKDGGLWIGTREGLLFTRRSHWAEAAAEGPEDAVLSLCGDEGKGFWAGTQSSGLWHLTSAGHVLQKLRMENGMPSDTIRLLLRETNGVLWVATPAGLARVVRTQGQRREDQSPATKGLTSDCRIFAFSTEHGLPSNDIRQLLDDGKGNLWIAFRQEICRVDKQELLAVAQGNKKTLEFHFVGERDGVTAEFMSAGGSLAACMPDGTLLFAAKEGVATLAPAFLPEVQPTFRVYIEEVGVAGHGDREPLADHLFRSLVESGNVVHFPAGTHELVFKFTMPEYQAPDRVRFKTLLEGQEMAWSRMTGERNATYTLLHPGKYKFRVMAARPGGAWTEAACPLSVEIAPFLWETGWFKLLVALIALGGVGLASGGLVRRRARIRLERVRRAAEERERVLKVEQLVESERARIARDIHDDLGAGLTEIGVLGDLATHAAVKEPDRVTRIQEMADKARRMVDTLDEIVWTVNPRNDTLQSFLYYAADYTRDFLRSTKLRCRLDLPESVPDVHLGPDRRHALLMVLKEALNNMVKHANASEALLRIRFEGDVLRMQITDNGQGFVCGNERHDANGLRGMRERLENVQGRFAVESRPGAGTTLIVEMTFERG